MSFYKDKRVLVTGGTGLIGIPLVTKLVDLGAKVFCAGLDSSSRFKAIAEEVPQFSQVEFLYHDLTSEEACHFVMRDSTPQYVFQLAGSKGSTNLGVSRAATFFDSHMRINMNMLTASHKFGVEKYLLTSTVGVYAPSSQYTEDKMWSSGNPAETDKYSAWAKRMAELQAEAYMQEYGWKGIVIVRPGSVYGIFDDFNKDTAMVVGSLIGKFCSPIESFVEVLGGESVRDFTYADDVADGMLLALEHSGNCEAFNLSCGRGYSIMELVGDIQKSMLGKVPLAVFLNSISNTRVLDTSKAYLQLGFTPKTSLSEGIQKTVRWYQKHAKDEVFKNRYNAFL